jgi:hypothetical protein
MIDANSNFYYFNEGELIMILVLYLDDILIIGNHVKKIECLKKMLENCFEMLDLG